MQPELTTLCYIEQDNRYLMLHRVKKERDINKDKWIGIGGHFEGTESPEECLLREVKEETGLALTDYRFRGLVTFVSGEECLEYMALFTATGFTGEEIVCDEGTLEWIDKEAVYGLNLWAGDKLFFRLLEEDRPFFSLKLMYDASGILKEACLDGRKLELLDVLSEKALPEDELVTSYISREDVTLPMVEVQERDTVHRLGLLHATSHIWVVRKAGKAPAFGAASLENSGEEVAASWEVLLQKRSSTKDSNPGCWDLSSAGHIDAGGEKLESAIRELREELGIQASPEEMIYLGYSRRKAWKPFYGKKWLDNQISYLYVYTGSVDTDLLRLQESEVEEVQWMPLDQLCDRIEKDTEFQHCLNPEEVQFLRKRLKGC